MRTIVVIVAAFCTVLSAQTGGLPRFEVTIIKPSDLNARGSIGPHAYPGGKLYVGYATLKRLIGTALRVQDFQISGGSQWMKDDMYDVTGLPPDSSPLRRSIPGSGASILPNDEQRQMLLALLIDRFGLKYHEGIKEGSVYLLVRGNRELSKALQPTEEKEKDKHPRMAVLTFPGGSSMDGRIAGKNASMPFIADTLTSYLDRPVIDRTYIQGSFDFEVAPPGDANADITNAILEGMSRLGLKLKAGKGPVRTVVIDRASKPDAN